MKCSHKGDFIIILLITLTSNYKGKAFVLFSNEKSFDENSVHSTVFPASKNTLQDLDSFPNMNNPDMTKHRIVKKQMVISDENQLLGINKNRLADKEKSLSIEDISDNFKDNNVNIAGRFNSWIIQKLNENETPTPSNDESERFIRRPKEILKEYEEKSKDIKRHKFRLKRDLLVKTKVDIPDIILDPDSEPSNEWTDASQDNSQKIPPEFKPKPKLMLKIIHLSCKRESKNHDTETKVGKREAWNGFKCLETRRRAFHPAKVYPNRLHPRSFLVRSKKKGNKKNNHQDRRAEVENQEKDDEEDDEENEEEEDDQDDEEEEEEIEYEDTDEESVSITPKPDRKDAIKEFFKTAKAAVIKRAKFDDGFAPGSFKAEGGKESLTSSENQKGEGASEKSKKVLIDANIKLNGAISHALKGILGFRKENRKENNEKLIGENKMEENVNVKNTESQLRGIVQHPLEKSERNKRHFLSLISKKNKDDECSDKGGLVSVDSLINGINSEYDREELLQKLQQIKYKDTKLNR